MALTDDQIKALLSQSPQTGRTKKLETEPRTIETFYRLNHYIREDGCSNEKCVDPRPKEDRGRNTVIKIGEVFCCRHCFLDGWLSVMPSTSNVTTEGGEDGG